MWSSLWITALQACQLSQHLSTCVTFSPFPSVTTFKYSWLTLSTPKVHSWWCQMWWVVGCQSSLLWFYNFNPVTWAKSPPVFWPVDILGSIKFHKCMQLKANQRSNTDINLSYFVSYYVSQHWNQINFRDLSLFHHPCLTSPSYY